MKIKYTPEIFDGRCVHEKNKLPIKEETMGDKKKNLWPFFLVLRSAKNHKSSSLVYE